MHTIVILIAAVLIFLYLNSRSNSNRAGSELLQANREPSDHSDSGGSAGYELAFISKGKLFYRADGQEIQQIQSPYVQGLMDRMERSKQLHGWKAGTAFDTSFVGNQQQEPSDQIQIQATSALITDDSRILYFLRDKSFGGLFEYDLDSRLEKRLVHKQNLFFEDLSLDAQQGMILCSQHAANGTANIGLMKDDGSDYVELTGGDTVDTAPARVPDQQHQVLFQSSGIARDESGFIVANGPASIQLLDREHDTLTTVLEDLKFDHMQPRVSPDGCLHFIRRPYEPPRYGGGHMLIDLLLFPFRLLRAVFHYLNFFSLMYTRKPLTSASGPQVQADLKEILIKGKRIDAENALRKEKSVNGVPSLVPRSWQLLRRNQQGQEQVLATNVASYDITNDGRIFYTNGYGVFVIDSDRSARVVLRDKLIADVIVRKSA